MSGTQRTIKETIPLLSREEECALGSGQDTWRTKAVPRLEIPSLLVHDGPHGLRKQPLSTDNFGLNESIPATCFPTAAITACSFDTDLLSQIGSAIAKEALLQEIDVVLGPGINIKRSPLCGRNFEYFSEDPYLAGELAAAFVNGLQGESVGASLKHFAANNQEFCRLINNSQVDERTLREIYLKAFEIVIRKAQPWTVMPSYNRINGTYACENHELLTEIARDEWGFEGLFVSDWGAVDDRVAAVRSGLDLEMPSSGGFRDQQLLKALENGEITEDTVDRAVEKLLGLIEKCGRPKTLPPADTYDQNHRLAKLALTESAVLLKNESALLPITQEARVLIVGELAAQPHYQGSGSSHVNATRVVSLTQAIADRGLGWHYLPGYRIADSTPDPTLIAEACRAAEGMDIVVVVAGLTEEDEAESYDRQHLELQPAQNQLISALAKINPNLAVVLQGGGVIRLPWYEQVGAALFVGLGGQAVGEACLDLLLGEANPSGKLAETWPLALEDVPAGSSFGQRYNTPYLESIFVGYRYYHTAGKAVRFPFGHGMSYSSFEFSSLETSNDKLRPGEELNLLVGITNTSDRAGKEVVQVYISPPEATVFRPAKELKAFRKIVLAAGESKQVELSLSYDAFTFWNPITHRWQAESGTYEILVGSSSANLRMKAFVSLESDLKPGETPDFRRSAPQYYLLPLDPIDLSVEQFESLPGSMRVDDPNPKPGEFDMNSTLFEAQKYWHGRQILKFVHKTAQGIVEKSTDNTGNARRTIEASTLDAPLRSYIMGGVPMSVAIGVRDLLNKRFLKGFLNIFKGSREAKKR